MFCLSRNTVVTDYYTSHCPKDIKTYSVYKTDNFITEIDDEKEILENCWLNSVARTLHHLVTLATSAGRTEAVGKTHES